MRKSLLIDCVWSWAFLCQRFLIFLINCFMFTKLLSLVEVYLSHMSGSSFLVTMSRQGVLKMLAMNCNFLLQLLVLSKVQTNLPQIGSQTPLFYTSVFSLDSKLFALHPAPYYIRILVPVIFHTSHAHESLRLHNYINVISAILL